jgi:hypothetical protein
MLLTQILLIALFLSFVALLSFCAVAVLKEAFKAEKAHENSILWEGQSWEARKRRFQEMGI